MKELLLILGLYITGALAISAGVLLVLGGGFALIASGTFILIAAAMTARGIARVPAR